MILVIILIYTNLSAQSYKIVLSSFSLTPPGMYGTNSLNAGSIAKVYDIFYSNNVINYSYPVYSTVSDMFARFETTIQGTKLIIRKASDGSFIKEFNIEGYNPQWLGNSGKLYYEKAPANGITECRAIDISSGADEKIGELNGQYYPPSDPALGAGAVSYDGKKIAYLKGLSIYIYDIASGTEKPIVKPDENNIVDDTLEKFVKLSAGPSAPNTIRHLNWSKDGQFIACFGTVSFKRQYPPDTTQYYPVAKQGIIVANTSTGETRSMYLPQNYTFEHPENFFFSPSGKTLAFNVRVNNKWHIFMANPQKSFSAKDKGSGLIIAGEPSKQYWALNPWSQNGSYLLYQNEDDGTLWYTTGCSDGQIILQKDVRRISIEDVQWADVNVNPQPYTITLVDINNNPIAKKPFIIYINGCKTDSIMTDNNGKFTLNAFEGDTLKAEHIAFGQNAFKPGHDSCAGDTMYYVTLDNGKFDGVGNRSYFELRADKNPTIICDHTTINYNLIVSIGWDAKREYLDSLASWCRELSNYYYDVSDGQIKFNEIDIYDNLQKWYECDIRISANNMVWPAAYVDSIHSNNTEFTVNLPRKFYGAERNTRYFTSRNNWLSIMNDYFWTTIGHELGHYMLGFFDEYLYVGSDGRGLPPNYNYGYMDSQYPGSGDWASEMSNAARYPNNTFRITAQWAYNGKDCWADFESNYEKTYNGVFCPIIKPSERVITGGFDFLEGPIIDVGKELKTIIYDKNTGAGDYDLIVKDPAGNVLSHTTLDLYKPKVTMRQGKNTYDGSFKVIGANVNDKLKILDVDNSTGVTFEAIININAITSIDKEKEQILQEPVIINLKKVNGNFKQVNTWDFDNNGKLNFKSYNNKQFSKQPTLEFSNNQDSLVSNDLIFDNNKTLYSNLLDTTIKGSGLLSINAYDDSQDSFFIPISYLIIGFTPILPGPYGDINLYLDPINDTINKFAILSGNFHTSRNGIDQDAEQSGKVHSITTYPVPISTEIPTIMQIGYEPEELVNKPQDWLRIFKWNEDSLKWSLLGGIVDTVNHYVRTSITSTGTFAVFTVNNPVNVEDGSMNYNIQISPNPCDAQATLTFTNLKGELLSVSLFNSYGTELAILSDNTYIPPGNHNLDINTSSLSTGVYFLRIKTGSGNYFVKFVVLR